MGATARMDDDSPDSSNSSPNGKLDTAEPVSDPSFLWRLRKVLEGTNGRRLTRKDVPFRDLTGKWVIISGSNNGVGRDAALYFAECGANVILACRNPPAHEKHPADVVAECKAASQRSKAQNAVVEWWEVDMTKMSSVNAFADRWLQTGRTLDILCNNAGTNGNPGASTNTVAKTEDGFEVVHQVNFLSQCLLTLRFLPSLARAERPRVVCTTSCMMFFGTFDLAKFNGEGCSGEDFYNNNKLFLQVWLTELQRRMIASEQYSHITINGVHPGYANTGIWHVERQAGWINWLRWFPESVLVKTLARTLGISAEQGSYAITHAATKPDSDVAGSTQAGEDVLGAGRGKYFNRIWESETMPYCQDPASRLLVWDKILEELRFEEKDIFSS